MRSWRFWLCTLAAVSVSGVLAHNSTQGASFSACILLLDVVFLLASLTLAESQQTSPSGFPTYMFLLPVGNLALVAWPMVISAAFLAITGGAISLIVLRTVASVSDTWWIALYLAGNVCAFQTVAWIPLQRPELRVAFIFVTLAALVAGPAAFGFGLIHATPLAAVYTALVFASVAVSVRGVGRARHGLTANSSANAKYQIKAIPAFQDAVEAQIWLEEKRNGMVMKVVTGMFLVLLSAIAVVAVRNNPMPVSVGNVRLSQMAIGLTLLILTLPPYFGFGGCCGNEKDNIGKDRGIVPFLSLRPLSTLQIVEAKARMSARLAFRLAIPSLAVATAILLLPTSTDGHYQPTAFALAHLLTWPQFFGLLGLYGVVVLGGIKTAVSGIWCTLGRLPVWATLAITMTPLLVVFGGMMRLVVHPDDIPRFLAFLPKLVWIWATPKLTALIPTMLKLRQSKLVPDALMLRWFGGCAVVGVVLFVAASSTISSATYSRAAMAAQIFCLLPLVRVGLAPIFVHRGRHA